MLENNWKDSAPKVPQEFHERFEETLRQIEETTISDNKRKNKKIRIRVLTVAAALCACMTVTVAAKEFLKCNVVLKERLNPSEEQQKSLEETNYIQNVNQSETHNGVTVALSDSLQDQGILYAVFEIKTGADISMDQNTSFEHLDIKIDGKSVFGDEQFGSCSVGGGLAYLEDDANTSAHLQYYEATFSYDSDYNLSGKKVEITLENLTEDGDKASEGTVVAQGTWNFEWTVGELDPETLLEVNKKCDFGGYEINVRSMEISPFFWKIYLDYQDAMKVYEDERNRFEYNGSDCGMDLYARTHIDAVRYKDGTVVNFDSALGGIGGGGELEDKKNGVVVIRNSFGQAIDVDQLQAVHFGNVDQWLEVR